MKRIVCVTLIAVCAGISSAASQAANRPAEPASRSAPASELQLQLDRQAPQWLQQYAVPSVSIAYIENGVLAWTAAYGQQSPGVRATNQTLYNIASLTKPISAEIILRMASDRKLSLDESLSADWVDPDIKEHPWSGLLTARLALSHQTGFANWRRMTGDVLAFKFKPGTQTAYSGEGYDYVGRFAERRAHRAFEDLARHYVFDPIGMKETSYTKGDWYAGRLAYPYGGDGEVREPTISESWSAADLVYTTTTDYAKFMISVMRDEKVSNEIAAQRRTITRDELTSDQQRTLCALESRAGAKCAVQTGFGLGWAIFRRDDDLVLWHDGTDWGFNTFALFSPGRRTGVVIFTNGENGERVIRECLQVLYPRPAFIASLDL